MGDTEGGGVEDTEDVENMSARYRTWKCEGHECHKTGCGGYRCGDKLFTISFVFCVIGNRQGDKERSASFLDVPNHHIPGTYLWDAVGRPEVIKIFSCAGKR